jgi:hypothetical protein
VSERCEMGALGMGVVDCTMGGGKGGFLSTSLLSGIYVYFVYVVRSGWRFNLDLCNIDVYHILLI